MASKRIPRKPRSGEDGGLNQTLDELIRQGRSGGGHLLQGTFPGLSKTISRNVNYSLVVIGDLFLNRSKAVQTRMLRDLKVFLGEHIRIPVISADELQKKYFLGGKQLIKFFVFILLVLGIYWGLFTNQETDLVLFTTIQRVEVPGRNRRRPLGPCVCLSLWDHRPCDFKIG